jgi:hypothetical protein
LFEYVPIWAFKVFFRYAPRRVACPVHGVLVEAMPWGYAKEQMTISYQVYLARWARRLSWKETADIFQTSLAITSLCNHKPGIFKIDGNATADCFFIING